MNVDPTKSLAARYYTDPAIFEAERSGVLSRTWQFACHASDLENTGDYFAFEMGGESLFCIKGRDGVSRPSTTSASTGRINWCRGRGQPASWSAPTMPGPTS